MDAPRFPLSVTTTIHPHESDWRPYTLEQRPGLVCLDSETHGQRVVLFLHRDELDRLRSALDKAATLLDTAAAPAA